MCFRHRGTGQSGQIVPGSPSPVLHDGEKQQILVPLFSPGRRTLILPLVAGVQAAARNDERGAASQRWGVGLIACRPRWLLRGDRTEWTSPDDCPRWLHYYPMSCSSPGGSNWLLHSSLPRVGRVGRKQFGKPSVLAKAEEHGLCGWGHWSPW